MINLQSNYPVLAQQEAAWPQMLRDGVERFGADSLRLPAFGGSPANRELAATWLGVPVERTWICTSGHHGTMAALLAAGMAGKTIAVEALTYPWFVRQAQMLGARVAAVAMDAEGLLPTALRELCEREPIAAVYTMPTQHNPTCATASTARREAIVAVARKFGLILIEDGAYGFLMADEPPRYIKLAPERAFYVESLSKRVMPGLRTAFLVSPEQQADQTALALRVMTSGSSTLLASMGCAMTADGSLQRIVEAKRSEGALRSSVALRLLQGMRVQTAPNAWHVWVSLPEGTAPEAVEAACAKAGVLVTGGQWFTAPGIEPARAVRLGFGGETDSARCEEGVRLFAEVVQNRQLRK